ncbi:hypothetical protein RFI_25084 [Reticulomyxa filosa]|uniref:t-SNARE coiled-coil homology domain-containing protein n=1 Tax=Reticulomyxa filosa TaxID=46433 RepID=X6MF59_RETFI|nr:hypothetical protein RFI_25084 [Reticulomyxa filosa]|eukprot:ETO12291.1 hypothetical protein RFI_25084 [Reticulomyxa filosa]
MRTFFNQSKHSTKSVELDLEEKNALLSEHKQLILTKKFKVVGFILCLFCRDFSTEKGSNSKKSISTKKSSIVLFDNKCSGKGVVLTPRLQGSSESEQSFDDKAGILVSSVRRINKIAEEINLHLWNQECMTGDIQQRFDSLQFKLQTRNQQVKQLLQVYLKSFYYVNFIFLLF